MIDQNPIVEEIRQTRVEMLAKHHGDLDSLVDELQKLSEARARTARPVGVATGAQDARTAKKVGSPTYHALAEIRHDAHGTGNSGGNS
jgi:hypothetical protein